MPCWFGLPRFDALNAATTPAAARWQPYLLHERTTR